MMEGGGGGGKGLISTSDWTLGGGGLKPLFFNNSF